MCIARCDFLIVRYLVYLKRVPVKSSRDEPKSAVKALVKRIGGRQETRFERVIKKIDRDIDKFFRL